MMKTDAYDLTTYLAPLWLGDLIENETVLFVGETDEAKLLFEPEEILSVRNYGLDVLYAEGRDFALRGGTLCRLSGSSAPFLEAEAYYRATPDALTVEVVPERSACPFPAPRYLAFGEGDTFTKSQVAVTYRHRDKWTGPIPEDKSARFSRTLAKLAGREEFRLHFYGDSITTGCNSSGSEFGGPTKPFADSWPVMIEKYLRGLHPNLKSSNTAVGGWTSGQGGAAFDERVAPYAPDLMMLAFGMNDAWLSPQDFAGQIDSILLRFHEKFPEAEVLLVSCMLPNIESNWFGNQEQFPEALAELEKRYDFATLANVTRMHRALFDAGKRYRDVTGNNVNHPNDFVARLYAQTLLATLLGPMFKV